MSKLYGDEETIKLAKAAKPGDNSVLVNMELVKELPEEFEAGVVKVSFDKQNIDKFFTNVGSKQKPKWYPHIEFMYKIAEARGISGSELIAEPIYEDVEIDEMNRTLTGQIIKKKVGYIVKKSASVLNEDGTIFNSGERVSIENAWEECLAAWHKEEKATKDYTTVIDGEYTAYNRKQNGRHYVVVNGQYSNAVPVKYETKWDRKCHFDEVLDKSLGKADSKAKSKAIREIVGLPTAFATEDLNKGYIIVSRIRRNRDILKLETAAKLSYLSGGGKPKPNLLFGEMEEDLEVVETIEQKIDTAPNAEPVPVSETKTPKQFLIESLETYGKNISEDLVETVDNILAWLDKTETPETTPFWTKAINLLKRIEEDMPEDFRVKHGLY